MNNNFSRSVINLIIGFFMPLLTNAQSGFTIQAASNSPITQTIKFDDIDFLDERFGMTCNGDGRIYRTNDSGFTWQLVYNNPDAYFRSIMIKDSLNAWAGNFGVFNGSNNDPNALFRTADGGNSWSPVLIPVPVSFGICGLFNLDNVHMYGVGRIQGPAVFIKSMDGGTTWTFKDMSTHCGFLVDCYFLSADTGFAIGGTAANLADAVPVILKTTDGGGNWTAVHTGPNNLESWCWKIDFTGNVFYVSIENSISPVICLKSADRGNSWSVRTISFTPYHQQAIGFLNDTIGWSGGYAGSHVHETIDGGNTWYPIDADAHNLNRIRRMNDSLLWASGLKLYKISYDTVVKFTPPPVEFNWSISHCETQKCVVVKVEDTRPNKRYTLEIFDVVGRRLYSRQAVPDEVIDLKTISTSLLYFVLSDSENSYCQSFLNY